MANKVIKIGRNRPVLMEKGHLSNRSAFGRFATGLNRV
jgi:hypothetical protein